MSRPAPPILPPPQPSQGSSQEGEEDDEESFKDPEFVPEEEEETSEKEMKDEPADASKESEKETIASLQDLTGIQEWDPKLLEDESSLSKRDLGDVFSAIAQSILWLIVVPITVIFQFFVLIVSAILTLNFLLFFG